MVRQSAGVFRFFAFGFGYHGLWLFLGQTPEMAFASHNDFARGLAVLNLSQPIRLIITVCGIAGLILPGLFATKPLLATAASDDELATAGRRRKLIWQSGILPWLLGALLIIPFRLPPLERAFLPLFGGVPLILTWLNAGRVKNINATVHAINKKISWVGIAALIAVFLGFRFIPADGIPFHNLFYQPPDAAPSSRVYRFVNGNWFNGNTFAQKSFYSVAGVLRSEYAGPADSTIDLQNQFVIPPFAEAHNHHFSDGQDYRAQINNYLTQGIFYAKNPNNTQKWTAPIRPHLNFPASVDAMFSNGGLTASGGHPIQLYEFLAQQNNIFGWSKLHDAGRDTLRPTRNRDLSNLGFLFHNFFLIGVTQHQPQPNRFKKQISPTDRNNTTDKKISHPLCCFYPWQHLSIGHKNLELVSNFCSAMA